MRSYIQKVLILTLCLTSFFQHAKVPDMVSFVAIIKVKMIFQKLSIKYDVRWHLILEHIAELSLNPKKTYEYKYEGVVNFGLALPNLAESGVRMTCKVKIAGVSAQTFILQVRVRTEDNRKLHGIFCLNMLDII